MCIAYRLQGDELTLVADQRALRQVGRAEIWWISIAVETVEAARCVRVVERTRMREGDAGTPSEVTNLVCGSDRWGEEGGSVAARIGLGRCTA